MLHYRIGEMSHVFFNLLDFLPKVDRSVDTVTASCDLLLCAYSLKRTHIPISIPKVTLPQVLTRALSSYFPLLSFSTLDGRHRFLCRPYFLSATPTHPPAFRGRGRGRDGEQRRHTLLFPPRAIRSYLVRYAAFILFA